MERRRGFERPMTTIINGTERSPTASVSSDESNTSSVECANSSEADSVECANSSGESDSPPSDNSSSPYTSIQGAESSSYLSIENVDQSSRPATISDVSSTEQAIRPEYFRTALFQPKYGINTRGMNHSERESLPSENSSSPYTSIQGRESLPSENSSSPYTSIQGNSVLGHGHPAQTFEEFFPERQRLNSVLGHGHPAQTFEEFFPERQRLSPRPSSDQTCFTERCGCHFKKILCFGVLLLLVTASVLTPIVVWKSPLDEVACQILTNEMVCPFKSEYAKIHIWNPSIHLKNGGGRTSYPLQEDTDVSIDGFNIRVKHGNISIRKRPSDCDEEGDYPIQLSDVNNTEITQNKLSVKVKDDSDVMHLDITPFTNASDAKNYTQIVCTGNHQCGTVVVDLQLQIQGFGTYYQPMECSRTNPDGKILDNYGYACTHIMTTEIFNRIENLTCKPTVESLEGTKTHSIAQQSIDVISATRFKFELDQGKPSTLKWNVNIPPLTNISLLQTENNGVIHQNESVQNERVQLFIRIEYHVAKLQVSFNPVTCIDNGTLELHFQNGDKQRKEIEVNGMSTFKACPEYLKVSVGDELKLSFLSCVPDDVSRYTLDLYGIHNRSGFFLRDQAISIDDHSGNFLGYLSLNELSVNYTKRLSITCADHEKAFKMSLQRITGKTIRHFTSLTIVNADRGRYESFSTGGDFREHLPAVVNQRLHLGCRPGNLQLYVNGSFLMGPYRLTEDTYSGEKIFSKSFSFSNLTMGDHGTTVSLHGSFIDDEGTPRYLSSTQEIRVLPDTFCKGRQHGCNFNHPYNANMYVACGEGLIADLLKCPYELVFVESNCEGQCCPQDETTNCRRP